MDEPPKNPPDNGISDYGNVIVAGSELAAVLGLSEAHIFTLKRRNVIQPIGPRKNEYRLGSAVRDYIAYKCATDSEAQADFHRERALKERANRKLRQILLEQTRSQLHRADDVRSIVEDSNNEIRSKLLAFAKRLAGQITAKHDPAEVKDRIESGVRELLTNLSRYRARDYYRRSKNVQRKADQSPQPKKERLAAKFIDKNTGPAVEKEQPAFGQPGWPKGKPRGSSPHPWASTANKKRWAAQR